MGKDSIEQQDLRMPDKGRETMGNTWRVWRRKVNHTLNTLAAKVRQLLDEQPWIAKAYGLLIWCSLALLVIGLFVSPDLRKIATQSLWSFYLLLQFWFLCRSKTLSWKRFMGFYMAGAYLVIPFTQWTMSLVHAIAGGSVRDGWSSYMVTPIVEEVLKLLPAIVYLLFSRKVRSLSLTDYALMGGAAGAGFQLVEEAGRRLLSRSGSYGNSLFGQVLHWELWDWFPGYFGYTYGKGIMMAGHGVSTALAAMGIGIALRLVWRFRADGRRRWLRFAAAGVPVLLYLWVTLNHMLWNASGQLPDWMESLHKALGGGHWDEPLLMTLILAAVIYDYVDLNRRSIELPQLKGERMIQPFGELARIVRTALGERARFGQVMHFMRERRELGFQLLYGNAANEEDAAERKRGHKRLAAMLVPAALSLLVVLAGVVLLRQGMDSGSSEACFACQFDRLQNWWDRLSGWEKLLVVGGGVALTALAVGFWPALGYGMTLAGIAGSGHEIAATIRRPSRLLEPQVALGLATDLALSRVPLARLLPRGGGSVLRQTDELAEWAARAGRRADDAAPVPRSGRGGGESAVGGAERGRAGSGGSHAGGGADGPQAQAAPGGGGAAAGGRGGSGGGRGSGGDGDGPGGGRGGDGGNGSGGAGRHAGDGDGDGPGGSGGGRGDGDSGGDGPGGGRGSGGDGNRPDGGHHDGGNEGKGGSDGSGKADGESGSSASGRKPGEGGPEFLQSEAGRRLRTEMLNSPSAEHWGVGESGANQGVKHFLDYAYKEPNRITSLGTRLGLKPDDFVMTREGFDTFTAQARRVVAEGASKTVGPRTFYYLDGAVNPKKGIIVIEYQGRLQSMMAGESRNYQSLIRSAIAELE